MSYSIEEGCVFTQALELEFLFAECEYPYPTHACLRLTVDQVFRVLYHAEIARRTGAKWVAHKMDPQFLYQIIAGNRPENLCSVHDARGAHPVDDTMVTLSCSAEQCHWIGNLVPHGAPFKTGPVLISSLQECLKTQKAS